MAWFPPSEFHARVQRVQAALRQAELDALIAYSVGNQPGPVAYLGGYEPRLRLNDVAFFVVTPDDAPRGALLANGFWDRPEERTWTHEVLITGDLRRLAELVPPSARRVGIAGYNFFPLPVFQALQAALPHAHFQDATELLKQVAQLKSPAEVEVMRRSAQQADAGARAFLANVRAGVSERLLQAEVDKAMVAAGAEDRAFPTFILSGPRVVASIGFAQDRNLETGDQVNVLCGAQVQGYTTEVGRVTTVGAPAAPVLEIMETAAQMQEAMFRALHLGVPVGQVAEASLAVARQHGLADYVYRSINTRATQGHGMGCWVSEPPPIYPEETSLIQANMTLSLEARLGVPGVGGAVITEIVLVTPQGAERLSSVPLRTWAG